MGVVNLNSTGVENINIQGATENNSCYLNHVYIDLSGSQPPAGAKSVLNSWNDYQFKQFNLII